MREITIREALQEALKEEMRRDSTVFVMGEDVAEFGGAYKITQGLLEEFGPERVRNTPLVESAIAGAALGAALVGMRPIAEIMYIDFTPIAMEQIFNQIAKIRYMTGGMVKVPLVIRTQSGGGVSAGPHHSQCLEALYTHIPGLKVAMPSTPYDAKGLLKAAIRDPNPVVFLENEILYGQSFDVPDDPDFVLPIGKAKIERAGADVTITAYSLTVGMAMEAAESLAAEGIDAEVINLRTIRPLDTATIVGSVKKTNRLVSVEEGWPACGIGSELAALMMEHAFDHLDAPVSRVSGVDVPMPYAANLEALALPKVTEIVQAAKSACYA